MGSVLLKLRSEVLHKVFLFLSLSEAYAVDIPIREDVAEQIVDLVATKLMLDHTGASAALVVGPAENVIQDVHVQAGEVGDAVLWHILDLVRPPWCSIAISIGRDFYPFRIACIHLRLCVVLTGESGDAELLGSHLMLQDSRRKRIGSGVYCNGELECCSMTGGGILS